MLDVWYKLYLYSCSTGKYSSGSFTNYMYYYCNYLSMLELKLIHVSKRGPNELGWWCSDSISHQNQAIYWLCKQATGSILCLKICVDHWSAIDGISKSLHRKWLGHLLWNYFQMNATRPHWWSVNTLVQVMAWCCQATSHYLSQCWPSSVSPYGVTRPQWRIKKNMEHNIHYRKELQQSTYIKNQEWIMTSTIPGCWFMLTSSCQSDFKAKIQC